MRGADASPSSPPATFIGTSALMDLPSVQELAILPFVPERSPSADTQPRKIARRPRAEEKLLNHDPCLVPHGVADICNLGRHAA